MAGTAAGVVPDVSLSDPGWPGCSPLRELPGEIAGEHGWEIVAKEVMPDHVHLFVRVGPTDAPAPAPVVRALRGRTARVLRQEFRYVGRLARVLWSRSCFAASVGCVWGSMVRRYIEQPWDAVMAS